MNRRIGGDNNNRNLAKRTRGNTKTILLVEDEESHAELVCRSFEDRENGSEWKLDHVASFKEAIKRLDEKENTSPTLIIADYVLPDGNGLDIIEKAGKMGEAGIPGIIMTSYGSERLAVRSLKSGAMDYVVKGVTALHELPWTAERVLREWESIIGRKRAEDALQKLNKELEERVEERTKELKDTRDALVRKEKLAVLGQLAGGVAHELRQPLGVINNATYYLKMILTEADKSTKEYLNIISDEVKNSESIISNLLELARTRSSDRQEINVSSVIEKALEKFDIPENIKRKKDIPGDIPTVFVDPVQMERVFYNIINNAIQAMSMPESEGRGRGGELAIKVKSTSASREKGKARAMVEVSFSDTGVGISEKTMKNLFEPLFTTKARGIGLGLSICKNLVKANDGEIEVQSEEGKGTTVTVVLPC